MTNAVDVFLVYTNLAFQLMSGQSGRYAEAFKLPVPNPIPPQAVSSFELADISTNLNGSITVSNFTFKFDRGYLERFYREPGAFVIPQNTIIMSAVSEVFLPRAHAAPDLARRGEEALRALGAS